MKVSNNEDWLIIANGEKSPLETLKELAINRKIIALDGATIPLIKSGLIPDVVLGDFDSIDLSLIEVIEHKYKIKCVYLPDQDTTDLEKGLRYIAELQPNSVIVTQATGHRIDHSVHNLRLLRRLHSIINNVTIYTETEKICFVKDKVVVISSESREPMALMAFPEAIVNSKGLQFDMTDTLLKFSERESTSNHLIESSARIQIQGEALLILSHNTDLIII